MADPGGGSPVVGNPPPSVKKIFYILWHKLANNSLETPFLKFLDPHQTQVTLAITLAATNLFYIKFNQNQKS